MTKSSQKITAVASAAKRRWRMQVNSRMARKMAASGRKNALAT